MKVSQVTPIDGYAESTESFGDAIGKANDALDTKLEENGDKEIVSHSVALATRQENGSTVYVCYVSAIIEA